MSGFVHCITKSSVRGSVLPVDNFFQERMESGYLLTRGISDNKIIYVSLKLTKIQESVTCSRI